VETSTRVRKGCDRNCLHHDLEVLNNPVPPPSPPSSRRGWSNSRGPTCERFPEGPEGWGRYRCSLPGGLGYRGVRGAGRVRIYRFTVSSGPCHPPQVGEWFGFIVNSKGLLQFKAKVLTGLINPKLQVAFRRKPVAAKPDTQWHSAGSPAHGHVFSFRFTTEQPQSSSSCSSARNLPAAALVALRAAADANDTQAPLQVRLGRNGFP
jgi:hypothetical protein